MPSTESDRLYFVGFEMDRAHQTQLAIDIHTNLG
jgi:hypothetical protein